MENISDGSQVNIAKLVINNQQKTELLRSTPLKTYSKKASPESNNDGKSRYGRMHKRNVNEDFLSTDAKVSHYLKTESVSRKHYFKGSPIKKEKNISLHVKRRGRPRKSLPLFNSVNDLTLNKLNTSAPSLLLDELPDFQAPVPISTETLPLPAELKVKEEVLSDDDKQCEDADWNCGDLAWASIGGFPYWPCAITKDPIEGIFRKTQIVGRSTVPAVLLHVKFFGDNGRRSWVKATRVMAFTGHDDYQTRAAEFCTAEVKKKDIKIYRMFCVSTGMRKAWQAAVSEAESLLDAPRSERVLYFLNLYPEKKVEPETTKPELKKRGRKRKSETASVDIAVKKIKTEVSDEGDTHEDDEMDVGAIPGQSELCPSILASVLKATPAPPITPRAIYLKQADNDPTNNNKITPRNHKVKDKNEHEFVPVKRKYTKKADRWFKTEVKKEEPEERENDEAGLEGNNTPVEKVTCGTPESPSKRPRGRPRKTPKSAGRPKKDPDSQAGDGGASEEKKEVARKKLPVGKNSVVNSKGNKQRMSGFQVYSEQQWDRIAEENPELNSGDVDKYLERLWNEMPDHIKARYKKSRLADDSGSGSEDETKGREDHSRSESPAPLAPPTTVRSGLKRVPSIFAGIRIDRVCELCLKGEDVVRCKGPCYGCFHTACGLKRYSLFLKQNKDKLGDTIIDLPTPDKMSKKRGRPRLLTVKEGKSLQSPLKVESSPEKFNSSIPNILTPPASDNSQVNNPDDNLSTELINDISTNDALLTTIIGKTSLLIKNDESENTIQNMDSAEKESELPLSLNSIESVCDEKTDSSEDPELLISPDNSKEVSPESSKEVPPDNLKELSEAKEKTEEHPVQSETTSDNEPESVKENRTPSNEFNSEVATVNIPEEMELSKDIKNVEAAKPESQIITEPSKLDSQLETIKIENCDIKSENPKDIEDDSNLDKASEKEIEKMECDSVVESEDGNNLNVPKSDVIGNENNKINKKNVKTKVETATTNNSEVDLKNIKKPTPKRKDSKSSDTDTENGKGKSVKWMCSMCLNNIEDQCFICNDTIKEEKLRCCVTMCGRLYHVTCVESWPQAVKTQGSKRKINLTCPQHSCHTCISDNPQANLPKFAMDKLVRCLRCPTTYHHSNYCIPAGSEIISNSQIICPRHYDGSNGKNKNLHHVNASWCFICSVGGSLICCEHCPNSFHVECLKIEQPTGKYVCEDCETGRYPLYGEIVWVKLGAYRWWPAKILFPSEIPDNIYQLPHKMGEFAVKFFGSHDHYWVNRGRAFLYHEGDGEQVATKSRVDMIFNKAMVEASESFALLDKERMNREAISKTAHKPPKYVRIQSNKIIGNLKLPEYEANLTPCDCTPEQDNPCGPNSDCINRLLMIECNPQVCPAKDKCCNQNFEKRLYPPLVPYKTDNRGWGLKTLVPLKKGDFVIEYVGEMIDEKEYQKRLSHMQKTKNSNYYFLTIDKDRMLDAGPKGNKARFMNHSCSPNCETQKWTVNGQTRVGLFTLQDVPKDNELVFNYQLETIGNHKVECKCGSPNCIGFIGGKPPPKTPTNERKCKPKPKRSAKKNKQGKVTEDSCFTCGEGGELLLCDNSSCPKAYHLNCLGLTKQPAGGWVCPWHQCSVCSQTKVQRCTLCINSYCSQHAEGNISLHKTHGPVCFNHTLSDSGSDWSENDSRSRQLHSEDDRQPKPTYEGSAKVTLDLDSKTSTVVEDVLLVNGHTSSELP